MSVAFNLFLNDKTSVEKRTLPRFPLNYLTFRAMKDQKTPHATFSIRDISKTGMQLERKIGEIQQTTGETFSGEISWFGERCSISAKVIWVKDNRLGLEFLNPEKSGMIIESFLSDERILKNLKALHKPDYKMSIPVDLKCWLQTDGPVELFMWVFKSGEISKIQFIKHKKFFEWDFFKGMKTGEVISIRDKETPLSTEDEFQFHFDKEVDTGFFKSNLSLISKMGSHLSPEDKDFIINKINIS